MALLAETTEIVTSPATENPGEEEEVRSNSDLGNSSSEAGSERQASLSRGESSSDRLKARSYTASTCDIGDIDAGAAFYSRSQVQTNIQECDSVADIEEGRSYLSTENELKEDESEKQIGAGRRCLRWRLGWKVPLLSFMTALTVGMGISFWPHNPTWELSRVDLDVSKFIAVMTGNGNVTDTMHMSADVNVYNPNFVGASTGNGHIQVFYKGALMGYGTTDPVDVVARGNTTISTNINIRFTEDLAARVMADAIADNFQLSVDAIATIEAKAGAFKAIAYSECHVVADALKVMSQPTDVIKEKYCAYHIAL